MHALGLLGLLSCLATATPAVAPVPAPVARPDAPAPIAQEAPVAPQAPEALPALAARDSAYVALVKAAVRQAKAMRKLVHEAGPDMPAARAFVLQAEPTGDDEDRVRIDTLMAVTRGMELRLSNFSGDITVEGWAKDAIRLVAERSRADRVRIARTASVLDLTSVSATGVPEDVEYQLQVPEWMPMRLAAIESDIEVRNTKANVFANSIRGDVRLLRGLAGGKLSSVEGGVYVLDSKGDLQAGSINNDVDIQRCDGNVSVQTVNGDVRLRQVQSPNIEASSMAGSIVFDSPFQKRGYYRLSSHSGEVLVGVPERSDVDVRVTTFNGGFESSFRYEAPPRARGPRYEFTLGAGGSTLELESFDGNVQLVRPDISKLGKITKRLVRKQREMSRIDRNRIAPPAPVAPLAPIPPKGEH